MTRRIDEVPEGAGPATRPAPASRTARGRERGLVIGVSALVLSVATLAAVLLLRPTDEETAGPGGTALPSATAAPSDEPTPEPSQASEAPSATPAPSAESPAVPANWTEAARFAEEGKRYVVEDLEAWSGALIAIGTVYEEEARSVFGPPPPRSGRVWRSDDGADWTDATPDGTFSDVELLHLFETGDGALVVIGHAYPEAEPVSRAWETSDGTSWTPVELDGFPDGAFVVDVASGPRGHVAAAFRGAEAHPLFSSDGRTWVPTLEGSAIRTVAAGDEGFVAVVSPAGSEPAAERVVASADGREWVDGTAPNDGVFLAAPRGGDWFAATTTFGPGSTATAGAWSSANGLEWSSIGVIPIKPGEGGPGSCHEAPAAIHGLSRLVVVATILTFGCGEGAVVASGGSYASGDGSEWSRMPFGDQAFAAGAAEIGDRVVIATDTRTGQADEIGVTFWIGDG